MFRFFSLNSHGETVVLVTVLDSEGAIDDI